MNDVSFDGGPQGLATKPRALAQVEHCIPWTDDFWEKPEVCDFL